MSLEIFLETIQLVLSAGLVGFVLLQSRGTGLSSTFGGTGFATSRRGVEKIVFIATGVTLFLLSISSVILSLQS
ncbi:MAG: preprotein translocase subunit SecG [bacterium]